MIRLVTRFADAMAERLEANDFKAGWWDMSPAKCLQRAEQELGELRRAIAKGESPQRVIHEAADVANFLAFLSENYADEYAERASGTETP